MAQTFAEWSSSYVRVPGYTGVHRVRTSVSAELADRVMGSMKKWIVVAGVAALLAGCGGGGGNGSTTTTGGGGGTGRTYPTFNLGSGALVQTVFLSGEGRVIPGSRGSLNSQLALIRNVQYQNTVFDFIPDGDTGANDEIRVQLDGFTINTKTFPVAFGFGESFRSYREYPLEIAQFLERDTEGNVSALTPSDQVAFRPAQPFDADVRVFPGRIHTVTVRLDNSMLSWDSVNGEPNFNPDLFVAANYNPIYDAMVSQFSDYVAFDISDVDSRPELSVSGSPADRVFFSGDGYAMSVGLGQASEFELLDPVNVQNGRVSTGPLIGPGGNQVQGANIFVLEDEGPDTTRFTSIVGTWRSFESVINPNGAVAAVAFPTSRESEDITPDRQQFVVFSPGSNGKVTAMFYGSIFYNSPTDPTGGTFKLYPIDTIDDAVPVNEVNGTISNLVITNGVVRRGDWEVTGTPPAFWPFPASGGFGVFRR